MPRVSLMRLLLLGAIWGMSFIFLRVAAPVFGPLPMNESPTEATSPTTSAPPYLTVIFTSQRRQGDHGYAETAARMEALARAHWYRHYHVRVARVERAYAWEMQERST